MSAAGNGGDSVDAAFPRKQHFADAHHPPTKTSNASRSGFRYTS
jgi:hypothetical protein